MGPLLKKMKDDLQLLNKKEINMRKHPDPDKEHLQSVVIAKGVIREVLSMFPTIGVKPDNATDEQTIKLLRQVIYMEKTRQLYTLGLLKEADVVGLSTKELSKLTKAKIEESGELLHNYKISCAMEFLPEVAVESEIIDWIAQNINFDEYENPLQAIGVVMKHFPNNEGAKIRQLIENVSR